MVISTLWQRMANVPEVGETIRRDGQQAFEKSLLPKVFDEMARKAYVENTDAFTSLFEDGAKCKAIMNTIGELLVEYFK